jgi:hypothetical protein
MMFTTGAKLYLGLTTAAIAALVVYGVTQNFGALGSIGLIFLVMCLIGLASLTINGHDSNISAMDAAATQTSSANSEPALDSMWPLVAAAGGVLLAVGWVTDQRYFIAGLVVLFAATLEWTVRAWAERASGNAAYNESIRKRLAHPLELPLAATVGLAGLVFGFSRIFVGTSKTVGPIVFIAAGAVILAFASLFAARRNLSKGVIGGVCALGAVGILGTGIAMASAGERDELTEAYKEKHYSREGEHQECGEEVDEYADHKASGSLALKSNTLADFTLTASGLELDQIAGFEGGGVLTVDRGSAVTVVFHNEFEGERRLRIFAGSTETTVAGTKKVEDTVFCTQAIEEGDKQGLTFKMPRPSFEGEAGTYYAEVPGVEGTRIEIVVPL